MSQIPVEFLYGLDIAVKKLRPFAKFQLTNTEITKWEDPTGAPQPTWLEIEAQFLKDKTAFEEWSASLDPAERLTELPPPGPASTEIF